MAGPSFPNGLVVPANPLPVSPEVGRIVRDTADGLLKWWTGHAWEPIQQPKSFPRMVVYGHSHAAEGGATYPDYGGIHKLSNLYPARLRSAAIGGAIISWHNTGTVGDGGWATVFDNARRTEQSAGLGNTLVASSNYTVNTSSINVAERSGLTAGQWIVVGTGTTTETMQVSTSYTPTTGAGAVALNLRLSDGRYSTFGHNIGEPVWNDPITYQAKDNYAFVNFGANDVPANGPNPVAYSTAGSSAGFVPVQHAMRAVLARLRLSVFYDANHVSSTLGGTWAKTVVAGAGLVAYNQVGTGGQTITINTPPSFPGGTVAIFAMCDAAGSGGTADYSVSGATTVATQTNALNAWNINAYNKNATRNTPGGAGKNTPAVLRITGLAAGVNTITVTVHPQTGNGTGGISVFYYLGWGIEAPSPPVIEVVTDPRTLDYALWGFWPYCTRPGNTYASSSGTTLTVQTAYVQGVLNSGSLTQYFIGDTITVGTGANAETRVIAGTPTTTTITLDSPLTNSHTAGEPVVVGLQDMDIVGGMPGFTNTTSRSCYSEISSVVNEFDDKVVVAPADTIIQKNPNYFIWDRSHYNDAGHAALAPYFYNIVQGRTYTIDQTVSPTVPDNRVWLPVQGNGVAAPTFLNSWTQYVTQTLVSSAMAAATTTLPVAARDGINPGDLLIIDEGAKAEVVVVLGTYSPTTGAGNVTLAAATKYQHDANVMVKHADPRFGYYKDLASGYVFVRGTMKSGTSGVAAMYQLPAGYTPSQNVFVAANGQGGDASVVVTPDGTIYGATDISTLYVSFYGSYPAEPIY